MATSNKMTSQVSLRAALYVGMALSCATTASALSRTRAEDFEQFWQRSLAERVSLRPSMLQAASACPVSFPVTETSTARGYYYPAGDSSLTPILYIYEDEGAPPRSSLCPDRVCFYLRWRDGAEPLAEWYLGGLPDRNASALRRSILTACQAVDLLRTCPLVKAPRVGLIGDGFGATVALAVAALMPEQTAFVIAHQPRPAYHRLPDGALTCCPMVRKIMLKVNSKRKSRDRVLSAFTYFDAVNFAPMVEAPALFIAGDADREAPLAEVLQLYHCLRCERDLVVAEGLQHVPSTSLPGFPRLLRRWLVRVEGGGIRLPAEAREGGRPATSP